MKVDFYKAIPIVFSSIAISISIATIYFTRQNLKKQLRLGKLEEILEILLFLDAYYKGLFLLFIDTEEKVKLLENGKKLPEYLEKLASNKESYTDMFSFETLIKQVSRLNVLSKAYLPNKKNLKSKALTIADIYFACLLYTSFVKDIKVTHPKKYEYIFSAYFADMVLDNSFEPIDHPIEPIKHYDCIIYPSIAVGHKFDNLGILPESLKKLKPVKLQEILVKQTFYDNYDMINDIVLPIAGEILRTATEFVEDRIIWDDDDKT